MKRSSALVGAVAILVLSTASRGSAGELELAMGAAAAGSDWRGDAAGYGSLRFGFRAWDLLSGYFLGRFGYGAVDQRLLTCLSVGVQVTGRLGRVRPYLRAGFLHQHEEPSVAFQQNPWGAIFGVGDGIRHRAGVEGAAGIEIPVYRKAKWELYASVEATTQWFANTSGPSWYVGGGAAFGFHYGL